MEHFAILWYFQFLLHAVSCDGFLQGSWSANGQVRLLGNSFGILGVDSEFDYVIIGGGTSGLTMAARLTENTNNTVAVIEAGSFYELDNANYSQIPAYDVYYSSPSPSNIQPLVDWGIVTTPQKSLHNRTIHYTQGKCLGGGSARNYLAYHRGTIGTFEQWSQMVGDSSYTFSNLLPYFQRSANFSPPDYTKRGPESEITYDQAAFSPTAGPLHVSYTNYWQPLSQFIKSGFSKAGLKSIAGFNSGHLLGFSEFTLTIDPSTGTRSSSETSFLQTAIQRSPLLKIYHRTLAKRILFKGKTVTGVRVGTESVEYTLHARKEVLVAAGAFRSPQILMVSGVGPQDTLDQLSIPCISNLPGVGQNLQDQPFFSLSYRVNVTTESQLTNNPEYAAKAAVDYYTNQTGPLQSGGGNFVGWEKVPSKLRQNLSQETLVELNRFPSDWPELELLPLASSALAAPKGENYAEVSVAVVATSSRGNVTITSANTQDNPLVNPNWLATKTDQEVSIQGFRRAREIAASWGAAVDFEVNPGLAVQSDAQILDFLRSNTVPIHHASATCAMGNMSDPNAVVDSRGRVFGVKGLRVIDASSFPLLPPGHIQSTVYMLAEKLADDIKSGH